MALVVEYETETTTIGSDGRTLGVDRQSQKKRIKVNKLDATTDTLDLAKDIVSKCKLIHESKIPTVDGLLVQLQKFCVS